MSIGWMDSWKISKARITSRLRQETFPHAGDSGFRPCRKELYQTRFSDRKGSAWKNGCPSLLEQLAIKKFQVILLELLLSAEEDVLGFGKALGLGQLGAGQFKGTGDVGNLEESVFGRLDRRDEFRSRGIDGKGLLGAFVHVHIRFEITKARIASRLRQESFPRAGDSGFRPCRRIFYQNRGRQGNGEFCKISRWR